jgi:hypothetical protein
MKEKAFRTWLETPSLAKRAISRAKRLGKDYNGTDKSVESVRLFENYLGKEKKLTIEQVSAQDIKDYKAWSENKDPKAISLGRWKPVCSYYRFLGQKEIADTIEKSFTTEQDRWEQYIKKRRIAKRLSIKFMQEKFDLPLYNAATLIEQFDEQSVKTRGKSLGVNEMKLAKNLHLLHSKDVGRISEFVRSIATETKARLFAKKVDIPKDELWFTLKWIDWRILPEQKQLRLLMDKKDKTVQKYVDRLASQRLANNLALLEAGKTKDGRRELADKLSIPFEVLTDLVNRADISRKMAVAHTVDYIVEVGFHSYLSIREVSPDEFRERVILVARKHGSPMLRPDAEEYPEYARVFPEIVES